ncbi:hypothetical protein [Pseudomonas sp. LP_7_YM]|uniref:hypothetical protein n=1 Tax=Pseudomonas sp. LP_7_YM TaxID=2485137 RepID=UPI0010EF32FD|nr:hypothetical protein [Pseudomonas sp. LP_7_YM]TDV72532.1 hypothetical protein EC915_101678 [Pseudomonas sp. LP_7_YM]
MACLSSVALALSQYMEISACSAATALERRAAQPDGTVSNGVISYSASDFHEQSPGYSGGTLQGSAASDAGSFDIHAPPHGNIQWMRRILFDCLDVTFSGGEAFNAAASQANLEHMRDPSTRSPLAAASTAGSTRGRHRSDCWSTCTDHK